jgi:predicted hotdog family 3-hydroxylacyl-ACP dehydratase
MSVAIENLLPHRAPMRWIDALLECTDTTAVASACFDENHFATEQGTVLESALVECIAQTVAAGMGARMKSQSPSGPRNNGMLVSVSNFKIISPALTGKSLRIEVRELKRFGAMQLVEGRVLCDGELIASGELMLYA